MTGYAQRRKSKFQLRTCGNEVPIGRAEEDIWTQRCGVQTKT